MDIVAEAEALDREGSPGPWITVCPRDQKGGPAIAHTGPTFGDKFPEATSVRLERWPKEGITWEQHGKDARLIARYRSLAPALAAEVKRLRGSWVCLRCAGRLAKIVVDATRDGNPRRRK
jgi:hypothetical protein